MMRGLGSGEDFVTAHQKLADRVLGRDVDGAQAMLRSHLGSTLNYVYPPVKGASS
jgi:DNA-binding GntR family transcriptional regulator